jgi:ElaB/YqjD/DUF883 family membrane-anchored ribosome-binding protein
MEESTSGSSADEGGGAALDAAESPHHRAREMTGPSWRAAKARLARVGDDVRIEARSTAYAAERYARENPWRVAGAAAVLGLLVGGVIGATLSTVYWRRRFAR